MTTDAVRRSTSVRSAQDPFLRLLASLSGQTVHFRCGSGGLEDALSSYCFLTLCERYGIAVSAAAAAPEVSAWFCGSGGAAADARGRPQVLLPLGAARADVVANLARGDVSVFCCDPEGLRWAELQGVPHDRRSLCRELSFDVDFADLRFPSPAGEGAVRLAGDGARAEGGDALALLLSGAGGRWQSRERCRDALQRALALLDPYAEVTTDSVDVAVLVARLGRRAVLRVPAGDGRPAARFAAEGLDVAVDPAPEGGPGGGQAADPRGACPGGADRFGPREREALLLRIAALEEGRDAAVAAAVAAAEGDEGVGRLVPARAAERRIALAESRAAEAVAAERARAEAAERRAAEAEAGRQRHERARAEAEARGARERDAEQGRAAAALEAAQDEAEHRRQALERRLGEARALLDRAAAREAEAGAAAEAARARLDALLASSSWRVTRPLRGLTRVLRGPGGPAGA